MDNGPPRHRATEAVEHDPLTHKINFNSAVLRSSIQRFAL
jgi:hypothetical protein